MRIAYFDCFSGLSGDMVLGALLDVGVDFDQLKHYLSKLALTNYALAAKPVTRGGLGGTKVSVSAYEKGLVRTWSNIRSLIGQSDLPANMKSKSLAIFSLLAEAEAKVHHKSVEQVHFHEVGAVDSVVDIVGSVIGLSLLQIKRVYFSPLPMGVGMSRSEHGAVPIPSPTTLEILKDVPLYSTGIPAELVTPTGAAIAKSYAAAFDYLPPMRAERTGYGAGRGELDIPNLLRLMVGSAKEAPDTELVTLVQAHVAGATSEAVGELLGRLAGLGALEAWWSPISFTTGQPAVQISLLVPAETEAELVEALLSMADVGGVRVRRDWRLKPRR